MSQEQEKPSVNCDGVAMAVMSEFAEALMAALSRSERRELLRSLAARAAMDDEAIPIRGAAEARNRVIARGWIRGQLPGWLSKFG